MWAWRGVLCVSVVCGLALDSNTIRSSKETSHSPELKEPSNSNRESSSRSRTGSRSNWQAMAGCTGQDCNAPQRGGCRNRPLSRTSDRMVDSQRHSDRLNRTKGVEMASCVRSVDCSAGLCCARYLTGKRCQRIPQEGDVCLLRGPTKLRRNLGRCDCAAGLTCSATASPGGKAQGACVTRQGQRKTRHSGKRQPAASC